MEEAKVWKLEGVRVKMRSARSFPVLRFSLKNVNFIKQFTRSLPKSDEKRYLVVIQNEVALRSSRNIQLKANKTCQPDLIWAKALRSRETRKVFPENRVQIKYSAKVCMQTRCARNDRKSKSTVLERSSNSSFTNHSLLIPFACDSRQTLIENTICIFNFAFYHFFDSRVTACKRRF